VLLLLLFLLRLCPRGGIRCVASLCALGWSSFMITPVMLLMLFLLRSCLAIMVVSLAVGGTQGSRRNAFLAPRWLSRTAAAAGIPC